MVISMSEAPSVSAKRDFGTLPLSSAPLVSPLPPAPSISPTTDPPAASLAGRAPNEGEEVPEEDEGRLNRKSRRAIKRNQREAAVEIVGSYSMKLEVDQLPSLTCQFVPSPSEGGAGGPEEVGRVPCHWIVVEASEQLKFRDSILEMSESYDTKSSGEGGGMLFVPLDAVKKMVAVHKINLAQMQSRCDQALQKLSLANSQLQQQQQGEQGGGG
eukprot:Cvel_30754.t1-p1 / transcript=Cvel_30754.t1 / gene=Cvel_30754 / organism=Chromera_velia_CCMP2878 / gene_product=hypothetical protein / transcript_product=hypothetical protein / location=Cvel_scaffold4443:1-1629(-) / protein_length=213 / sequence_SO=supercontig / SO=protein_coding / is_pseudo=false